MLFQNKTNKQPVRASSSTTLITTGTRFIGNIISSCDLRIDGEVVGDIECQSRVVVGTEGKVEGNIQSPSIDIAGIVHGNLMAGEMLNLRSSAHILGDLITNQLQMESGVVFNGQCKMGDISNLVTASSAQSETAAS